MDNLSNFFVYLLINNKVMEAKLKILFSEFLLFATIGFFIYLLVILAGFIGCCVGITEVLFDQILLVLVIIGVVTFVACSYFICFKEKSKNR